LIERQGRASKRNDGVPVYGVFEELPMWDRDKLIVYIANQMLNQGQQAIATILKIPIENVPLPSQRLGYVLPDERLG
jgi:hypothetical protein